MELKRCATGETQSGDRHVVHRLNALSGLCWHVAIHEAWFECDAASRQCLDRTETSDCQEFAGMLHDIKPGLNVMQHQGSAWTEKRRVTCLAALLKA